jgi:hypothetical protein
MQVVKTTLLFCLLAFMACKQDPKPVAKTQDTPTALAGNTLGKPEVILYCVSVDNLQLRDQPSLTGSNVITKFPEGSFVTGTGEKSANKVEIDLRGIPYTDHFYKVASTTPEHQNGWAFGGALVPVYSGTASGSPDLGKLSQLSVFLKSLNTKDLKSGKKAWDFVVTNFADVKGAVADATYILLSEFLSRMEYEGEFYVLAEKINWTPKDFDAIYEDKFDMNKYPLTKSFAENGFRLESGEGMVFPISDWQRLHDFFTGKITPVLQSYLDQDLMERKALDSDDGGLMIPLADMADRAIFWEKFNKDNPYFVMADRTKISEQWMRAVVISGMDNTPMYSGETKAIEKEFKDTWAAVQQKYPGTQLAQKCKEIADICAANSWKYTDKVEQWHINFVEQNAQ